MGNAVQSTAFLKNTPVWESAQSMPDRRQRRNLACARQALGEVAYQHAWTTGLQLQVADVVELADRLAQLPIAPPLSPGLTPREFEALALVAQGHPDRKMARLLGISPTTASKHVGNLLGKLGLHNRVELARWAMGHGLADGAESRPPRS